MKVRLHLLCLGLGLLIGCASVSVRSDRDPNADFSKYKTFTFSKMLDTAAAPVEFNEFNQKRVRDAIENELKARGYSKVDPAQRADLMISIYLRVDEKTKVVSSPGYSGGPYYYGYYAGYRSDWVRSYDYKVGTLLIDVTDVEKNQLVWQGVGEGELRENPRNVNERIRHAVEKIFKQYPVPTQGHL